MDGAVFPPCYLPGAKLWWTLLPNYNCKEIQPVHSEGDQPWDFFGRNDARAETAVLWPPHVKSWLIGKDSDAGRDWGQEEKGTTEDEMAGWHHWLDGCESEWTPGVGDGQGGLACCDSWGCKESDTTEWLNWTETVVEVMKIMVTSLKRCMYCCSQCSQPCSRPPPTHAFAGDSRTPTFQLKGLYTMNCVRFNLGMQ